MAQPSTTPEACFKKNPGCCGARLTAHQAIHMRLRSEPFIVLICFHPLPAVSCRPGPRKVWFGLEERYHPFLFLSRFSFPSPSLSLFRLGLFLTHLLPDVGRTTFLSLGAIGFTWCVSHTLLGQNQKRKEYVPLCGKP